MTCTNQRFFPSLALLGLILLLSFMVTACRPKPTEISATPSLTIALQPTSSFTVTPTDTPAPPTATLVPLAAKVNGEAITLEEYQMEIARYQAAQQEIAGATGTNLATKTDNEIGVIVLDDLIAQTLLAQAASEAGYVLDEVNLQTRIDQLISEIGGEQLYQDWLAANLYSDQSFRLSLERSVKAAWMRDQILAGLPESALQVHVRQILLYNSSQAEQVFALLQSGQDFAKLAAEYDPVTGGEMGWFPQGYLIEPALEATAFNLQPNQYSTVIQTRLGFHILQLVEIDPNRPLDFNAKLALQMKALENWLKQRREQSTIEPFTP